MEMTLAAIRSLHTILTTQRGEHERMRAEMLALREHSRRMRRQNRSLYALIEMESSEIALGASLNSNQASDLPN